LLYQLTGDKMSKVPSKTRMNNEAWFDILRMAGAVTSTSSGTSALFNNKTGGYSIANKRKKRKKRRDKEG